MCTVTYVPLNKVSFTLTSNRDENITRAIALLPQITTLKNCKVLFPKDQKKGGTWIGVTDKKRVLCLLNGAYSKHACTDNYRKSRGLVVLDFFNALDSKLLLKEYNLENIEPFTLLIIEQSNKTELTELKWDGNKKHVTILDAKTPHIWSSSTLYNLKEAAYKEQMFLDFIKLTSNNFDILNFHKKGTNSNPNIFLYANLNSPIKTISVTQITCSNTNSLMLYQDLKNNTNSEKQINYSNKIV